MYRESYYYLKYRKWGYVITIYSNKNGGMSSLFIVTTIGVFHHYFSNKNGGMSSLFIVTIMKLLSLLIVTNMGMLSLFIDQSRANHMMITWLV